MSRHLRPLLTVLVVLLTLLALRLTRTVTMPLGLALFFLVLAWPLQRWLETRFSRWVSFGITVLTILLLVSMLVGALLLCVNSVAAKAPEYQERFGELFERFNQWTREKDFPIRPSDMDSQQVTERVVEAIGGVAKGIYHFLGLFALMLAMLILALLEVRAFRRKIEERIGTSLARKLVGVGDELTWTLQRFMLTRSFISLVTGIAVGLFTWAIGLDFPFVWGLMSFLLNYIPIIGSTIAVFPPTLVALLHPEAAWQAPVTLGGLTVIQFTMGNYAEPQLEGKVLSFSPLVLFYSIVFWGWVWGIPGALIGVPITASIAILCRHFESSRWVHDLLAK